MIYRTTTFRFAIVSRGDWLRNAANFRRPAYRFGFDVENKQSRDLEGAQVFKMADDLFVSGDDFQAILGILEKDEALEEEFTAIDSDVS